MFKTIHDVEMYSGHQKILRINWNTAKIKVKRGRLQDSISLGHRCQDRGLGSSGEGNGIQVIRRNGKGGLFRDKEGSK